jgi:hypothetical protein
VPLHRDGAAEQAKDAQAVNEGRPGAPVASARTVRTVTLPSPLPRPDLHRS